MQLDQILHSGMQTRQSFLVQEDDSASHVGSGSLRLLATPRMIAYIEQTARLFVDGMLPEGYTSVGIRIDLRHLAATPVGGTLEILCEVIDVDNSKVDFHVQVHDNSELVGEGTHQRAVIEIDRFMRRLMEKARRLQLS